MNVDKANGHCPVSKKEAEELLFGEKIAEWNTLREAHPEWIPDLSGHYSNESLFLDGIDLHGANLKGWQTWRLSLRRANLTNVDLSDADLAGAEFEAAILRYANFEGTSLWQASFAKADLCSANLRKTDLTKSNFHESNLTKADLRGARFEDTYMRDAILTEADLRGADFLTKEQIESVKIATGIRIDQPELSNIVLPDGIPQVFLSYAWADQKAVQAVDQWLRDKGARVIIDDRDFVVGESIREEILRWIGQAGIIVCFISGDSRNRHYPKLEREIAESLRGKGKAPVIYFNLDDTVLDLVHEGRLYIPGHRLSFVEACQSLWQGILRTAKAPSPIDLRPYKVAGKEWTRLGNV